jgi:outer membrane protein
MFGKCGESNVNGALCRMQRTLLVSTAIVAAALCASAAQAETIGGALVKAYLNNPSINQQRATVRATDENLPKAEAQKLPQISASGNVGTLNAKSDTPNAFSGMTDTTFTDQKPRGYGATVSQLLYDGGRINNSVSAAESQVLGQREQLRNTEQNVLLQALTYYMDTLRDTAIVGLQKNNVSVLQEQLRQTTDRFNVGELTRTDVAQAQAALALSQAQELGAETNLSNSMANYRQAIGDEPRSLAPVAPLSKQLPKSINQAVQISQAEHPAIIAQLHGIDAAALQIKINEGSLLPTLGVQGSVQQLWDPQSLGVTGARELVGSVTATLNVPIFDGGATYAGIRQAKEQLGAQELATDSQRDQVRAAVVSAWGANLNSYGVLKADKAQVDAAEVALVGVREEAKVGQRTTLDVLNAEQTVLNARVQLVTAQHDQVVASYSLLSAIGRLSTRNLGLGIEQYDPRVHFDQVKTKRFGTNTPDGR